MTDNQDPLQTLWQQQSVTLPSARELQAKWQKERAKHYWFSALDIGGLLLGPLLLLLLRERMHWFEVAWLLFVVASATLYTGYIIWLRRLALGRQDASTADYLLLLQNQYRQNIKIAVATKYSTLAIPPMFFVMFIGAYYLEIFEPERLLKKLLFAGSVLVISLPPLWIWADKRAKRFQRELTQLSQSVPIV